MYCKEVNSEVKHFKVLVKQWQNNGEIKMKAEKLIIEWLKKYRYWGVRSYQGQNVELVMIAKEIDKELSSSKNGNTHNERI
jgi:hypothetical protein